MVRGVHMHQHVYLSIVAILIGILGGYGALLFRYAIKATQFIFYQNTDDFLTFAHTLPIYLKIALPALGGLIVGPLVYFGAREAKGHGVPVVMEAVALRDGHIRPRVALVTILASGITIGSGGSVGREGPIVQIGSSIGSTIGQLLKAPPLRQRTLVGCGAAAGLAIIVLNAISDLGGFHIFLVSVILAGIIQIIMGYLRAGIIGYYFPSSVIAGMLAGIGIIIFLKQIPHAIGYDNNPEGDYSFQGIDGENTFTELIHMFESINIGSVIVTLISLAILIFWDTKFMKSKNFTKIIPGPLVVVASGIILNNIFSVFPKYSIGPEHLVSIPVPRNFSEFAGNFSFPDFQNSFRINQRKADFSLSSFTFSLSSFKYSINCLLFFFNSSSFNFKSSFSSFNASFSSFNSSFDSSFFNFNLLSIPLFSSVTDE